MSDFDGRAICIRCGRDLTSFDAQSETRRPCPRCGDTRRRLEARAVLRAVGTLSVSGSAHGSGSATVLAPTVEAIAEIATPTIIVERQVAAHFDHLVRTYPPTNPGDEYVIELVNPDTGPVDIVIDKDRAEGWRRLAGPFSDDT